MSDDAATVTTLDDDLLQFIGRGEASDRDHNRFEALARRVFAHQYQQNGPYRRLCDADSVTPDALESVFEIPACPTDAFKEFELATFPIAKAAAEYHSSGTTADATSRHFLPHLRLYEASLWESFRYHVIPDRDDYACIVLAPPRSETPHSSLGHMLGHVAKRLGDDAVWLLPGPNDPSALLDALAAAEQTGRPILLLGTAFAFVHACDSLAAADTTVALPPLSRVMETGGYKGRSRELKQADLHRLIAKSFGVDIGMIENEYGMTEMGSQSYDGTIRHALGLSGGRAERVKLAPPWCISWVVDPANVGREVGDGEEGILKHLDLVNRGSVSCLLTADWARRAGDGYVVLGRAEGAQLRGCSLALEELRGG